MGTNEKLEYEYEHGKKPERKVALILLIFIILLIAFVPNDWRAILTGFYTPFIPVGLGWTILILGSLALLILFNRGEKSRGY
jgi:hypothetical protein